MKGIILAGGTGSRLYPLTKVTNKHLLPVGIYPMIFHAVYKLKEAGITDILIVTGRDHMGDVVNLLGSGFEFGVQFTYKVQDQAGGIAQALGLAEDFVGLELMAVILGDNVFEDDIVDQVHLFENQGHGARILLSQVENPNRFGVPEIDSGRVISIAEKPANPKSSYAVTGVYFFDHEVFSIIRDLAPSERGEYEITDVNNAYIVRDNLTYGILSGWWTDAGTPSSYALANNLTLNLNYGPGFGGVLRK